MTMVKDLINDLEKGDRTKEHLKTWAVVVEPVTFVNGGWSTAWGGEMAKAFDWQAAQSLGQQAQQYSRITTSQQAHGMSSTQIQNALGGW